MASDEPGAWASRVRSETCWARRVAQRDELGAAGSSQGSTVACVCVNVVHGGVRARTGALGLRWRDVREYLRGDRVKLAVDGARTMRVVGTSGSRGSVGVGGVGSCPAWAPV